MTSSKNLIQASAGNVAGGDFYPYTIDNSVRFASSSDKLTRTNSGSGSTKGCFSMWVKRSNLNPSASAELIGTGFSEFNFINSTAGGGVYYPDTIGYYEYFGGNYQGQGSSSISSSSAYSVYRDVSAWYHMFLVWDTTLATGADRYQIWINNQRVTLTGVSNVAQNTLARWFYTGDIAIGNTSSGTKPSLCYLAEVVGVEGTAYAPTDFAEDKNGVWVPKEITGLTFGNNGFYLDFANSGALGTDVSGNGNNFTVSGLTSSDQMPDTPTNNFPTWNPLLKGISQTGVSTSDGNMVASYTGFSGSGYWPSFSTMTLPKNGKVYFEMCLESVYNGALIMGIMSKEDAEKYAAGTTSPTMGNLGYWDIHDGSAYAWGGDGQPDYATLGLVPSAGIAGGVVGFAIDLDAGKGWIRVNGTWILSGDPANGTNPIGSDIHTGNGASASGEYVIFNSGYISVNAYTRSILNCGQDSTFSGRKTAGNYADENGIGDFLYSVPSGYLALCTANLPEPTIGPNSDTLSDEHFDIALWTGTGTTQNITSLEFQPDFVWMKARTVAYNNWLFDAVRGTGNLLASNTTDTETSYPSILSSFNSNGFTTDSFGSTYDFVAWNWKANGSGVSNTDGSITSTVSANQDAGFSIITYTGNGTSGATIGHGLNAVPKAIWVKDRSDTNAFTNYFESLGTGSELYFAYTQGVTNSNFWITSPTTSVFSASSSEYVNASAHTYVAYAFAEVEGFSSFGSYTGNGSADGPFIYTGFRPAWFMLKKSSGTGWWYVFDSERNTYNLTGKAVFPNSASAESDYPGGSSLGMDFLSNGVKLRGSQTEQNGSGTTYIYMAFAENPFKYSNAR